MTTTRCDPVIAWYPPVVLHEGEDVEIYWWPDGEPNVCHHGVRFDSVPRCWKCGRERDGAAGYLNQ